MILVSVGFLVRGATVNLRAVGEPWKGNPCEHWATVVLITVAYIDNTSASRVHSLINIIIESMLMGSLLMRERMALRSQSR